LIERVNGQPLATPVNCLGDGHDGIWNVFRAIAIPTQRREILDWFHLVENLHKVGGTRQQLDAVEALLWKGDIDGAIEQVKDGSDGQADNFIAYLNNHRHRIVNTLTSKPKGLPLVPARLNQPSNRLEHASSYLGHSGKWKMFLKSCCISVLT